MPTIAIDESTHKEAKKLSKTHDLDLGELVHHCIMYFKKTGINPSEAENESPYKAIKELDKHIGQIVAFIRTQEQEKLNPLLERLLIMSRQLDGTIKKLPTIERFNEVTKSVNDYAASSTANHQKAVDLLKAEHKKINDENKAERDKLNTTISNLTNVINNLQAGQKEINNTIEAKLKASAWNKFTS